MPFPLLLNVSSREWAENFLLSQWFSIPTGDLLDTLAEDDYLGILWGVNDTSKSLKQDFSDKEPFHLPVVQGPPSKVFLQVMTSKARWICYCGSHYFYHQLHQEQWHSPPYAWRLLSFLCCSGHLLQIRNA